MRIVLFGTNTVTGKVYQLLGCKKIDHVNQKKVFLIYQYNNRNILLLEFIKIQYVEFLIQDKHLKSQYNKI